MEKSLTTNEIDAMIFAAQEMCGRKFQYTDHVVYHFLLTKATTKPHGIEFNGTISELQESHNMYVAQVGRSLSRLIKRGLIWIILVDKETQKIKINDLLAKIPQN